MEDGSHVPPYYRDQMLLLMEVMDLETAYYMEWKPETTWEPEQMGVTIIKRDREWFAASRPKMREFYEDMVELRAKPKEELLRLFPPAHRPTSVRPPKSWPKFGYQFDYRPPTGLPSGDADSFYELSWFRESTSGPTTDALLVEEICAPPQPELDDDHVQTD